MRMHGVLLIAAIVALAGCTAPSSTPEPTTSAAPAGPPQIVSLEPANGATNVTSGATQAVVTFDQPMGGGMSFTTRGGPDKFPEMTGKPVWSADKKTITATMQLGPNRQYVIGVNSPNHANFKNEQGVALVPVIWEFTTGN
ncbi:MAG: Ig-like domain-containing protein [Candidatus Hydrogenedentes bacterium]|nr:Ig-like domain-containing protein [Candidatus Hydrogenedentota bacterium]